MGLQISSQDFALFKPLKLKVPEIVTALKGFNARKKSNMIVESEEE